MTFVRKSIDWAIIIASGTILLAVAYGIWCDVIDGRVYKPVLEMGTRFSGPTHLVTQRVYRPGDMVFAKVGFQKQRNIEGALQWQLIDHRLFQYPKRPGSLPQGVFTNIVPVEKIPLEAAPGEHWFCGVVSYKVNWLSTVSYPIWTDKFEVVK